MNTELVAGFAATGLGILGYLAGITVAYPGRSFSLTLVMLGMALTVVGQAGPADSP